MEINTHDSEVFVSLTERSQVAMSVCAAVGIGALVFGAGFLIGRLTKKTAPVAPDYSNVEIADDLT